MAFITAEDESGEAELICFPTLYTASGSLISENKVLVFSGNPEISDVYGDEGAERISILLKSVCTPEEALNEVQNGNKTKKPHNYVSGENKNVGKPEAKAASDNTAPSLYIKVTAENESSLENALALASRTEGNSRILVYFEAEKRLAAAKGKTANVTERLLAQLKSLMGESNIAVK